MQEYIIGNIVGISQVIIGHPFDTIKTNIQNGNRINSYILNPRLLYKGICYPFILNSFSTSLVFGSYDYFNKKYNNKLYAGVLSGFINSILLTPFDYKKIQSQIHTSQKQPHIQDNLKYKNNNINNIFKTYYSGFIYSLSRETIAIPIYFYTYYYLVDNQYANPFFAGGVSGINSWLITYPIDTIKTRAQIYQHKSLKDIIKIGNIYNGLSITLIRAFIVNSSSFYIYDYIKRKT